MTGHSAAVILAAGKGKRMKSSLPKVLHKIGGRPIIKILLDRLIPLGFERIIVVIGHEGEQVQKELLAYDQVTFAWQREQLGTGHAVKMAKPNLEDFRGVTLVTAGDVPFLSINSIHELFATHREQKASATCLTAVFDDPKGYGRIVRDGSGQFLERIVEDRDADANIRKIKEINSGTFCFDNEALFSALEQVTPTNAQGEYYLTDVVKIMHNNGLRVSLVEAENPDEVLGVNSVEQLEVLAEKFAYRA